MLGASYGVPVAVDGGSLDLAAPLVGAALLLSCELAYWSHELRTTSPDEPGALAAHTAWLAVLALGTLVPAAALLVVADVVRVSGVAAELAAAVVAGAAIAVVALAVHRGRLGEPRSVARSPGG